MINLHNRLLHVSFLFLSVLLGCKDKNPAPDPVAPINTLRTVHYTSSMESFPNPERGFLHLTAVFSEGSPLSSSYLQSLRNDHISLVWRLYYFEKFKQTSLSQSELDLI
ncbi:MAG: hypothetical protein RJQ14_05455, partial [Marinoscillum sp.]